MTEDDLQIPSQDNSTRRSVNEYDAIDERSGAARFSEAVLSRWETAGSAYGYEESADPFKRAYTGTVDADTDSAGEPALRVLSQDPLWKKIIMIVSAASLLLFLISAVGKGASYLTLLAPAMFLALVFLDHPMDTMPMAVPVSVFCLISLVGLIHSFSWGDLIAIVVMIAAVLVYWLLVLRRFLPERTMVWVLLILFAARAIIGFAGFLIGLKSGFPAALACFAAFLFAGANAAALFFAVGSKWERDALSAPVDDSFPAD